MKSSTLMQSNAFENSKENSHLQKKIKGYTISYCNSQLYGKGIRGQLRLGFFEDQKQKKLIMFRIMSLPSSVPFKQFIALQKFYSNIAKVTRIYSQPFKSASNQYIPMQYFPKTFFSQLSQFKKNYQYAYDMVRKLIQAYSWLYFCRISHNNISLKNIGITFDTNVKLMDFIVPMNFGEVQTDKASSNFQERSNQDLQSFRQQIITHIFDSNKKWSFSNLSEKKKHNIEYLIQKQSTWMQIFERWGINNTLSTIYPIQNQKVNQGQTVKNMIVLLHQLNDRLDQERHSQFLVDIKYSIMLLMYSHLLKHNKKNEDHNNKNSSKSSRYSKYLKQDQLRKQEAKLRKVLLPLPVSLKEKQNKLRVSYYNSIIHDMMKDYSLFCLSASQRLALICGLIPQINHQYIFEQIVHRFSTNKKSQQKQKLNFLLSQGLLDYYWETISENMIQIQQ